MFQKDGACIDLYEPDISSNHSMQKHCFILHGWDLSEQINLPFPLNALINPQQSKKTQMDSIHQALNSTFHNNEWHVWRLYYQSDLPFPVAANILLNQLKTYTQFNFSHAVFIGYSTGGLIARSMVAHGFPIHALITLATPHTGLLSYASVGMLVPSIASMLPASKDLKELNSADEHLRHRYNFFGLSFNGHWGKVDYHHDDGLVHIDSAIGRRLLIPAYFAKRIHLNKRDGTMIHDLVHNHEALDAKHLQPLLNCCHTILSK